jgi:filamentous hemagglutinin
MAQAPFRTAALTATGDVTLGASGQLTVTASNGNIATTGTGSFGATTVTSLNASSGGITNAGAIAGATTINASGVITGGTLTDGTALTITAGNLTGATTVSSATLTDGAGSTITGGSVTATNLTDGAFSVTGGAITGVTTMNMSGILTIGSGGTTYAFPTARGTSNQILKIDGSGNLTFQDDGGATGPGGASGNIQFNDGAGGFGGEASLNWDSTNDVLELGNGGTAYAGLASNTQAVAGGATTAIDTFAQTSYVAAKYLITAENTSSNEVHTMELLISADGSVTNFVPFADVFTGGAPLFSVAVSGTGTVSIDVTNVDGGNAINVQFMRTTLA